jgi:hypothetical protein
VTRGLRRIGSMLLVLPPLFSACSSDEAPPFPARASGGSDGEARGGAPARGGESTRGGVGLDAGRSGAGEAGAPSDAGGSAANAGEGGAAGGAGPAPSVPPVCAPSARFGAAQRLAISTAGDDELGSITPDELTIAWVAENKAYVADRTVADAAFGEPIPVQGGSDYFARVATSPDGLQLVGVRIDGASFGLLTRTARGRAFDGAPDESGFGSLYSAELARYSEGPFADPLFDATGRRLLYSALDPESDGVATIYESNFTAGSLPWGVAVQGPLLFAVDGAFRRPSGLSSDARTLFYWDEVTMEARAAWRPSRDRAFASSESLGDRRGAAPNAACDRIYFSLIDGAARDLFFADRE